MAGCVLTGGATERGGVVTVTGFGAAMDDWAWNGAGAVGAAKDLAAAGGGWGAAGSGGGSGASGIGRAGGTNFSAAEVPKGTAQQVPKTTAKDRFLQACVLFIIGSSTIAIHARNG